MGKWPTADPWLHTELFSLFVEKSEEETEEMSQVECGLQVQMSENTSKRLHGLEGCNIFLF